MKTPLHALSQISIASPCSASWDDMIGDERTRYCGHCEKNVYNLSALTTEAAYSLIQEKEGKLCGRFFRREDGTILTADCPVGLHHRIQRKRRFAVLAVSLAGMLGFTGCTSFDDPSASTTAVPPVKQEQDPKIAPRLAVNPFPKKNVPLAFLGGICPPGPQQAGLPLPPLPVVPQPELLPAPREVKVIEK